MVESTTSVIREIKDKAHNEEIPIMQEAGIDFLTTFVIKNKTKTVLEIGTAIGYSAIMMALASPIIKIVSIERDEERYLEALKNIKRLNLEDRITLIFNDALDVRLEEKFDLIFIDAAKGKNIDFFEHFRNNLDSDGYIITDNINFHGYLAKEESEIKSRNLRGLVRKIREYINYLKTSNEYITVFYEVGDGISVTKLKY